MDTIIILDFGSQYNQLIARRVRELGVYSEIIPFHESIDSWMNESVKGIILSGGPNSVYDDSAPTVNPRIFSLGVPILGICYGMQLMQHLLGGKVSRSNNREYGKQICTISSNHFITNNIPETSTVWMSHGDHVDKVAPGFEIIATTPSAIAIAVHNEKHLFTLQFHPEVTHTEYGTTLLKNYVLVECKTTPSWNLNDYINDTIQQIKNEVGSKKVILGLSGGVDSSVAATLIHKAIGNQLECIFVDTGLLRKDEGDEIMSFYKEHFNMKIERIDARDRFFFRLKGIHDPEKKRKVIGNTFIDVFEEVKQKHKTATYLAQGTIYPDVIESVSVKGPSETIKSHHNVGGLPSSLSFKLLEPLKELFKDEVRKVGLLLDINKDLVMKHPFPGPGLGIRILGEVTKEKVTILQKADAIFIDLLRKHNLYNEVSQAFVVLLPVKTVGVMGDKRTYEYVAVIRSADTFDFMTASFSKIPFDVLDEMSSSIINKVQGINRIVYDITSKPPGTIEWE